MPTHMFIIHCGLHGESAQGGHKVITNRCFLSVKKENARFATTPPSPSFCLAGQAFINN